MSIFNQNHIQLIFNKIRIDRLCIKIQADRFSSEIKYYWTLCLIKIEGLCCIKISINCLLSKPKQTDFCTNIKIHRYSIKIRIYRVLIDLLQRACFLVQNLSIVWRSPSRTRGKISSQKRTRKLKPALVINAIHPEGIRNSMKKTLGRISSHLEIRFRGKINNMKKGQPFTKESKKKKEIRNGTFETVCVYIEGASGNQHIR